MNTRQNCPICNSEKRDVILTTDGLDLVQCSQCSFTYLKDIPDEEVLYEDYHDQTGYSLEEYSENGQDHSLKALWHINQQRIAKIREFTQNGKLLDIGCGSGAFMLTAKEYGFKPKGIDVSNKAVDFITGNLNLEASTRSVSELEESYNVITLWHVLEHFIDPVSTLIDIREKLDTNGMLFGEVPNWNSIKFQLSGKKWEGGNHPIYHRSFFTPKTLEQTIRKAGFSEFKILHLPYTSSGKKNAYYYLKKGFNKINRDAFLSFVGWK